ncbi:MAG: hypothetical protein ACREOO_16560 [bacterium]
MKDIVSQVLMLAGFTALVYLSIQCLKIHAHILPPAVFVGPIKSWQARRECIKKYKRAQLHDPNLASAVRNYLIAFRVLCVTLILFEVITLA